MASPPRDCSASTDGLADLLEHAGECVIGLASPVVNEEVTQAFQPLTLPVQLCPVQLCQSLREAALLELSRGDLHDDVLIPEGRRQGIGAVHARPWPPAPTLRPVKGPSVALAGLSVAYYDGEAATDQRVEEAVLEGQVALGDRTEQGARHRLVGLCGCQAELPVVRDCAVHNLQVRSDVLESQHLFVHKLSGRVDVASHVEEEVRCRVQQRLEWGAEAGTARHDHDLVGPRAGTVVQQQRAGPGLGEQREVHVVVVYGAEKDVPSCFVRVPHVRELPDDLHRAPMHPAVPKTPGLVQHHLGQRAKPRNHEEVCLLRVVRNPRHGQELQQQGDFASTTPQHGVGRVPVLLGALCELVIAVRVLPLLLD
mmetsp:Transcript_18467/g.52166  ORF Transcript_18467/g.52166 Transcript_18467/m.52166 type:complete len:368 (+) Transcript_18467:115-1218(+)